jgi:hypothetical protein
VNSATVRAPRLLQRSVLPAAAAIDFAAIGVPPQPRVTFSDDALRRRWEKIALGEHA